MNLRVRSVDLSVIRSVRDESARRSAIRVLVPTRVANRVATRVRRHLLVDNPLNVWWRLLLAYLATAALLATVLEIVAMPGQAQYQALISHGVHASGRVVPDNELRGGLGYAFAVQGQTYTMSGSFDTLSNQQVGDAVPVVYEESNPGNNCSCDPAQVLNQEQVSPLIIAFWMSLSVPLGYAILRRMRSGQSLQSIAGKRFQMRVGPPSRFFWWAISAILLSIVSAIARALVQPVIYLFVVVGLGLIWFPLGVLLDLVLTPRLRRVWPQLLL